MMLLGAWERMSAERAHQMGLVSEVVPPAELRERAMWVAKAIASAPVMAVQGTLRAIWMTHELSRREALAQVSTFVALGTLFDNIAEGQETFEGDEPVPSGGSAEPAGGDSAARSGDRRQLAVDVPGMSVPHDGCDESAVNPFGPAFMTQAQVLGGLCPKSVA